MFFPLTTLFIAMSTESTELSAKNLVALERRTRRPDAATRAGACGRGRALFEVVNTVCHGNFRGWPLSVTPLTNCYRDCRRTSADFEYRMVPGVRQLRKVPVHNA